MLPYNLWLMQNNAVIPNYYWKVHSEEERIKNMCKKIYTLERYIEESSNVNKGQDERIQALEDKIKELTERQVTK